MLASSVQVTLVWHHGLQWTDLLVYIGTILIGFEFIRKINRLEVILLLIAAWPLGPIINAFPMKLSQREKYLAIIRNERGLLLKLFYAILLISLFSPLILLFLILFLVTEMVNWFDKLLNASWVKVINRFEGSARKIAGKIIETRKQYRGLSPKAVVREMKNPIPFLPVLGITLIIVAFIIQAIP